MLRKPPDSLLALTAPLIAVAVACVQIMNASQHHLSPWKGGGFGMFSTVAAPSGRFARLYISVDGERIPVLPPSSMQRQFVEVRTFPTPGRLDDITEEVARSIWEPYQFISAGEHYRQLLLRSGIEADRIPDNINDSSLTDMSGLYAFGEQLQMIHMVEREGAEAIKHDGAFLQIWAIQLDGDASSLTIQPIREASHLRAQ